MPVGSPEEQTPGTTSASASASIDELREHPCWGAQLLGDDLGCTPDFAGGTTYFQNKFCPSCQARGGLVVSPKQLRVFEKSDEELPLNKNIRGFWKETPGGDGYRIINNTRDCRGPQFVVTRAPMPDAAPLPKEVLVAAGVVKLHIQYGTLVPQPVDKRKGLVQDGLEHQKRRSRSKRKEPPVKEEQQEHHDGDEPLLSDLASALVHNHGEVPRIFLNEILSDLGGAPIAAEPAAQLLVKHEPGLTRGAFGLQQTAGGAFAQEAAAAIVHASRPGGHQRLELCVQAVDGEGSLHFSSSESCATRQPVVAMPYVVTAVPFVTLMPSVAYPQTTLPAPPPSVPPSPPEVAQAVPPRPWLPAQLHQPFHCGSGRSATLTTVACAAACLFMLVEVAFGPWYFRALRVPPGLLVTLAAGTPMLVLSNGEHAKLCVQAIILVATLGAYAALARNIRWELALCEGERMVPFYEAAPSLEARNESTTEASWWECLVNPPTDTWPRLLTTIAYAAMCIGHTATLGHLARRNTSPWLPLRVGSSFCGAVFVTTNTVIRLVFDPSPWAGTPFPYAPGRTDYSTSVTTMGLIMLLGVCMTPEVRAHLMRSVGTAPLISLHEVQTDKTFIFRECGTVDSPPSPRPTTPSRKPSRPSRDALLAI